MSTVNKREMIDSYDYGLVNQSFQLLFLVESNTWHNLFSIASFPVVKLSWSFFVVDSGVFAKHG